MFIQVNDSQGKPIDRCRVVLACVGLTNPDGSLQADDKVTREGGNVAWTWYPKVETYELRVNTYEPLAQYSNETRRVSRQQLENEQQVFSLKAQGAQPSQCPADHDKDQFRTWFDRVKVGSTVTQAAMEQMKPALVACGFEWQNFCRPPNQWRPRIHQPPFLSGPCSGSTHDVDCGDFGGPWVLTFRY